MGQFLPAAVDKMKVMLAFIASVCVFALPLEAVLPGAFTNETVMAPGGGNNLKTNLVAFWAMDAASGNEPDSQGSNTLNQNGTLTSVIGVINNARAADGNISNFFSVTTDSNFSPGASSFTCTFWAKPANLTQASFPTFLGISASSNESWLVYYDNSSSKATFEVSANGTSVTSVAASSAFANTATFRFIAVVWDGINIKISIDGGSFSTTSFAGPVFSGTGVFRVFEVSNGSASFNGAMDLVTYSTRAWSLAEVQDVYNGGSGRPYSYYQ